MKEHIKIDIDKLIESELNELNHRIVNRLRLLLKADGTDTFLFINSLAEV